MFSFHASYLLLYLNITEASSLYILYGLSCKYIHYYFSFREKPCHFIFPYNQK